MKYKVNTTNAATQTISTYNDMTHDTADMNMTHDKADMMHDMTDMDMTHYMTDMGMTCDMTDMDMTHDKTDATYTADDKFTATPRDCKDILKVLNTCAITRCTDDLLYLLCRRQGRLKKSPLML